MSDLETGSIPDASTRRRRRPILLPDAIELPAPAPASAFSSWIWTRTLRDTGVMSADEIDSYLAGLDEPKRATLERLRASIMTVVPDADQCISYGVPAFKVRGKAVAGFVAFNSHLSYLPHSGSVLDEIRDYLGAYETSKGSLRFAMMTHSPTVSSKRSSPPALRARRGIALQQTTLEVPVNRRALFGAAGTGRHRRAGACVVPTTAGPLRPPQSARLRAVHRHQVALVDEGGGPVRQHVTHPVGARPIWQADDEVSPTAKGPTGVSYRRPDTRPTWRITDAEAPGEPAERKTRGLVTARLNRRTRSTTAGDFVRIPTRNTMARPTTPRRPRRRAGRATSPRSPPHDSNPEP